MSQESEQKKMIMKTNETKDKLIQQTRGYVYTNEII